MKVLQFPLARITICFVLGILCVYNLKIQPEYVFGLFLFSILIFAFCFFWERNKFRPTLIFGLTVYFFSFTIGMATQIVHTDLNQKKNYIHQKIVFEETQTITLTIREKLKSNPFSDRYIALINTINQSKYSGKILLNIKKYRINQSFEIGTRMQIKSILYKNSEPKNPDQFDYGKYLENKQIYAQAYVSLDEIKISNRIEKDIWYYTARLRTKIITNLEKQGFNKKELNVAIALILGQQQDIASDVIQDYQYAGAVHILSVSGLHIGFILLFVSFILKPIPNTKKGAFLKLTILLISLSLFGILAGLAPSVVRSVTMFSFVAIGNHLRRSVNIYHTLLVSILLILLVQPFFLFDVGFQLSYLALFFIIWFQPLLASVWKPKLKGAKYIWDILTVSFAAQIGTLPLSIYYFHQFPGLFFVSNLIIIPLMGIIMSLGVLVMALAAVNATPLFLTKILEWSIYYLNKIVHAIASVETFIIRDLSFNCHLLMSSYMLILTAIIWFKKPSFNRFTLVMLSIILFQISNIKNEWNIQKEQEWIVYNTRKNTLITERKGKKITLYINDNPLRPTTKNNLINSYLIANFAAIKSRKKVPNVAFFKGEKILILDSLGLYPKNINPTILVLTQSPKINLDRMLQNMSPKIVVADASNYKTIQKLWKKSCEKQKIPFHTTAEKGFYSLN
jgi:competence protein ComEC